MVAACGLGGVVFGMFHMVTHAFFKACLFLCSGSVIHGCHHEQDMRRMGGLRKLMPITFACMLASTLAIAGIPLFSGFYSKDKIIQSAFEKTLTHFEGVGAFAAFALPAAALLTAFYMFRLIFMTFTGTYRGGEAHADHGHHDPGHDDHAGHDHGHEDHGHAHVPHESPWPMTVALVCLGLLGVLGGHFWLTSLSDPLASHTLPWFLKIASLDRLYPGLAMAHPVSEHVEHQAHSIALYVSLGVAIAGLAIAGLLYGAKKIDPARITRSLGEVYHAVANKYWVDEFVNATAVRWTMALASFQKWFDEKIVDGIVNGVGILSRTLGFGSAWVDLRGVDGAVNGVGAITQAFGSVARLLQTGRVQQYVSFAVAGGILLAAWLILS
jgi:NADH-quinone oxidoreductase subunit L